MRFYRFLIIAVYAGIITLLPTSFVAAQAAPKPVITFNSFTGVYHLSRDSRGLSLLTTEETIKADFPGNGSFYGIKRVLPKDYQNHSINIKILNVVDAAGNTVPYKTASDNNNLLITTGDPAITLYGPQTIKIKYHTSGVVNLDQKTDEFLLNVNGRGWDQPFDRINSTLYIPASFRANLKDNPTCYTSIGDSRNNDCQINTEKSSQTTIITSKAESMAPHQALVVKVGFEPATFTNDRASISKNLLIIATIGVAAGSVASYLVHRHKKK